MDWEVGANRESRAEGGEANDNFWKMKQPEIFKVGLSPSWTHYVNGEDLYAS